MDSRYPSYIGLLAGMLFMNEDFTEADELFAEARKRGYSGRDGMRIYFKPLDDERRDPLRLNGIVSSVKAGFAFVRSNGYPDFFCPGSKFGQIVMERDLRVTFTPGFTARGNQATNLALS
jgi:hypothetical protein